MKIATKHVRISPVTFFHTRAFCHPPLPAVRLRKLTSNSRLRDDWRQVRNCWEAYLTFVIIPETPRISFLKLA